MAGVIALTLGYVLSQFFRSFIAALSPRLRADLGVGPDVLSDALGAWLLTFALAQFIVGPALDRFGPRRTAFAMLLLGGGGGAALLAAAHSGAAVIVAMGMIGVGCAPVLMSSFYLFSRIYDPAKFSTYAATIIGVGMIGNIASAGPIGWAADGLGWRGAVGGLAVLTVATALAILVFVTDPPRAEAAEGDPGGGYLRLLRLPALWPIFPLMATHYAATIGLRGLWMTPYLTSQHGFDAEAINWATTLAAATMIVFTLGYGPLERIFKTRKWVLVVGNLMAAACFFALAAFGGASAGIALTLICCAVGFGTSFGMLMAHGRSFVPAALTGRGVTLLNFLAIGVAGVMQIATSRIVSAMGESAATFQSLWALYGVFLLIPALIYCFSEDAPPQA